MTDEEWQAECQQWVFVHRPCGVVSNKRTKGKVQLLNVKDWQPLTHAVELLNVKDWPPEGDAE